jgi:hypothetical protein
LPGAFVKLGANHLSQRQHAVLLIDGKRHDSTRNFPGQAVFVAEVVFLEGDLESVANARGGGGAADRLDQCRFVEVGEEVFAHPAAVLRTSTQPVDQSSVVFGAQRHDELEVTRRRRRLAQGLPGVPAVFGVGGRPRKGEHLFALVDHEHEPEGQPVGEAGQKGTEQGGIRVQGSPEGVEGRRFPEDGGQIGCDLLARRRPVRERVGAVGEECLGQLTGEVVRGADSQHRVLPLLGPVAGEAVADALLLEERDDTGHQEGGLADAAFAVQDQQPGGALVEEQGEPPDVVIAAGEQRPVFAAVVRQRAVRVRGQRCAVFGRPRQAEGRPRLAGRCGDGGGGCSRRRGPRQRRADVGRA